MTDTQNNTDNPIDDDNEDILPVDDISDDEEEEEEDDQPAIALVDDTDSDTPNQAVMNLMDVERAIKTYHASLGAKRNEAKKLTEMINDTLENDQLYYEQGEKVKEVKAVQQKTREQLMSVSSIVQALEEMKELRGEMKELQKMLSENLMKFYQTSKLTSITMEDGETYGIEASAKLVKQMCIRDSLLSFHPHGWKQNHIFNGVLIC